MAKAVTERFAPVRRLLEAGQDAAAAELFVETVAFGKGAWAQLPPPLRETFAGNAATCLDKMRDPDGLDLDMTAGANTGGLLSLPVSRAGPHYAFSDYGSNRVGAA